MNGARLLFSLMLLALPAAALPAVRRTRAPRAWAVVLAISLGTGFVLLEASLIHAALPLTFTVLGLDALAAACRELGGHLFGDSAPYGAFAGLLALTIAAQAIRGAMNAVRTNSTIRRNMLGEPATPVGGYHAVFLPLRSSWAVAIPGGGHPRVVLSTSLVGTLEGRELDAVMHHEMAHLEHHHVRFLLLGTLVYSGLWFLPWSRRADTALRLSLERWADELAAAESGDARHHVRSAVSKLSSLAPSALASYRIRALEEASLPNAGSEWGWPTMASSAVPLALALTTTLVAHLSQVIAIAGGS